MNTDALDLELTYSRLVDLWQRFCANHSALYEFTCEEYMILLRSEIEELDVLLKEKEKVIESIRTLEGERKSLIQELNEKFQANINSVSGLLDFFQQYEAERNVNYLGKFNGLLIEVILKIQDQNKKNQLFLNKAIISLRDIRQSFQGPKASYTTYNSSGTTVRNVVNK